MCLVMGIGKILFLMDLILKMCDYLIEKGVVVIFKVFWVFMYVFFKIKGN